MRSEFRARYESSFTNLPLRVQGLRFRLLNGSPLSEQ